MNKYAVLHLQIGLNKTCGVTRIILRIIKNSQNFEHHVISLSGNALDRFEGYNYKIINEDRSSFLGTVKIFFSILRYVRLNNIRIIHAHHRYFDFLTYLLKEFVSVKTVTTVHSKVYKRRLFSYKSDRILAVSKTIKLHLIEYFKINPSKLFLISNFVDTKEINITKNKEEIFTEIGLIPESRLLGYFGRLDIEEKGVDILLNAVESVVKNYPSVFLILAGDGVDEIKLKDMAKKKKLPVKFVGNLDNIWNYLNACEIVILPSRVEPFNLVMIESGLLGKSVIGANVDGIAEIIKDHETGTLFCKENVADLKDNIIELLSDNSLKDKIGKSLKNDVLNKYTAEKIIPQIENFYNKLLQSV